MCEVNRREFLAGGTAFLSLAAEMELLAGPIPPGMAEAGKADLVAPDIYFHEGRVSDSADAVCNNGWIIFEDYVLVIDANFPAGAKLIISKIRSLTDKPIRFAFDTHHHGRPRLRESGLCGKRCGAYRAHRCDRGDEAIRSGLLRQ